MIDSFEFDQTARTFSFQATRQCIHLQRFIWRTKDPRGFPRKTRKWVTICLLFPQLRIKLHPTVLLTVPPNRISPCKVGKEVEQKKPQKNMKIHHLFYETNKFQDNLFQTLPLLSDIATDIRDNLQPFCETPCHFANSVSHVRLSRHRQIDENERNAIKISIF